MQPLLTTDNKLIRFIVEPGYRWLRHLMLCLLLLTVSYGNIVFTYEKDFDVLGWVIPLLILVQFALYLSFYLNIYLLVPRLFLRGRYFAYCIALFALLTLNFACSYYMEITVNSIYSLQPSPASYANPSRRIFIDYVSSVSVTGMCCLGTTITILFRNWLTDSKRKQEMESEHRRNRIIQFKDTVNPAFLSDILLIAARSTGSDPGLCADILVRLSRFLRYRLYDSGRELVFLHSEAAYLDNYLSLVAHLRNGFTYSVRAPHRTGTALVTPSLLTGVTDSVLNNSPEGSPLDLSLGFETDQRTGIIICLTVRSAGNLPACRLEGSLGKILDMTYPCGYDLTVRGDGNRLDVTIGIPQTSVK